MQKLKSSLYSLNTHRVWSSLFSFFLFLGVGFYIINNGYLHEDAYILFTYAENLASGEGITYNTGGVRAEGATDFLWMLLISILNILGIDSGLSSILLNSVGAFLLTYLLLGQVSKDNDSLFTYFFYLSVPFIVIISPLSSASFSGFSTLFYSSFFLLQFYILIEKGDKYTYFVPWVGVTLGLIRPDGVILGAGLSLVGFITVRSKRSYLVHCFGAAVVGSLYFTFRYLYFGLPFPLPFYVKSTRFMEFESLRYNLGWLIRSLFLFMFYLFYITYNKKKPYAYVLSGIVMIIFLIFLSNIEQSQNISFRFQAPVLVVAIYSFVSFLYLTFEREKIFFKTVASTSAVALYFLWSVSGVSGSVIENIQSSVNEKRHYVNIVARCLDESVNGQPRMALTEAGRMHYWTRWNTLDMVGLNSPNIAVNGVHLEDLKEQNPDLLFIHTAGTFDEPNVSSGDVPIISVRSESLPSFSVDEIDRSRTYIRRAPMAAYKYLRESGNKYEILMVNNSGSYNHLYAVKKGGMVDGALTKCLREAKVNGAFFPHNSRSR